MDELPRIGGKPQKEEPKLWQKIFALVMLAIIFFGFILPLLAAAIKWAWSLT